MSAPSSTRREATTVEGAKSRRELLELVVEELLEIRVAGELVSTTMRTPGDDHALALGFLHAEGIIESLADVGSVFHCGRTDSADYGNAIDVTPGPGVSLDIDRLQEARRMSSPSSACGVCGRSEVDRLVARLRTRPERAQTSVPAALLLAAPSALARGQSLFARTGGSHAACALNTRGELLAQAEDIGRHNAVDKVVGHLLHRRARERAAGDATVLVVSGRASFEIVQKAAVAGFSVVASVSAPSSLAVATAESVGITLASFVREGRFTLYTHPERIG
jgi:FdhD protein